MCNTKNEVCQIQNSLFVQYILITSDITVLLLQEMVISCKLCTNNSQSKCQNIKVSYKSASQVQWMQNIYMTEWFLYDAIVASSFSREQWDTAKEQEEYLGTLQESQGWSFVTTVYPRDRLKLRSVFMTPNPSGFTPSLWKKYVEIT